MSDQSAEVDVAVIGAAGSTGQALIRELVHRGKRVRALVHRETQKALFPAVLDVQVVELDHAASLVRALSGAKVAHYIPPVFNASEEQFGANVIAAAIESAVSRLVYHSVLHAPTPAMPHHLRKTKVELAMRESPVAWTIVQPTMYAQTPLAFLNGDRTELNPGFDVTRAFTPIDIEDLSEAVANILIEDKHEFATYELAGSERLTFVDMAAIISEVTGTPVVARSIEPQLVQKHARAQGLTYEAAEELRLMMDHYNQHGLLGNDNVLQMIIRHNATSFRDAAKRILTK